LSSHKDAVFNFVIVIKLS